MNKYRKYQNIYYNNTCVVLALQLLDTPGDCGTEVCDRTKELLSSEKLCKIVINNFNKHINSTMTEDLMESYSLLENPLDTRHR